MYKMFVAAQHESSSFKSITRDILYNPRYDIGIELETRFPPCPTFVSRQTENIASDSDVIPHAMQCPCSLSSIWLCPKTYIRGNSFTFFTSRHGLQSETATKRGRLSSEPWSGYTIVRMEKSNLAWTRLFRGRRNNDIDPLVGSDFHIAN